MGVDDYADRARDFADEQGGTEGLKDKADRLKDIAGGEDDMGDNARDAMDELRGSGDDDLDEDSEDFDR